MVHSIVAFVIKDVGELFCAPCFVLASLLGLCEEVLYGRTCGRLQG